MKTTVRLPLVALLLATFTATAQSVSIGDYEFTPNPGAILDVSSTSKGVHSNSGLTTYNNGVTGGAEYITLTPSQMPNHDHTMHGGEGAGNYLGFNPDLNNYAGGGGASFGARIWPDINTRTSKDGGGEPHENRPPFRAIYFIIKL